MDSQTDTPTDDRTLVLTRVFAAPQALVFKAWTDPAHAVRWWGPMGFSIESCAMDVRPGGAWRIRMRSPEGSQHTKRGVYRVVEPPNRLEFTWAWEDATGQSGHETVVRVTFEAVGTGTRLTLHQSLFETTSARDMHRVGWTSCLDRFTGYLSEPSSHPAEPGVHAG
jgi:uncharacterized protein YndB with AHSA1/START domain